MNEQRDLEKTVKAMIEKHGLEKTIDLIKNSRSEIFIEQQHYPNGVYVYCNSPEGGLMVGEKR